MSAPIPLQHVSFTSTLHKHKKHQQGYHFNVWPILLTAVLFFLILSIYNFALALFNYYFTNKKHHRKDLRGEVYSTLGFLLLWALVALFSYLFLNYYQLLNSNGNNQAERDVSTSEHPLLRSEVDTPSI